MTTPEFNAVVENRHNTCASTLINKAKEYARGDRLSNFKRAAAALKCTPERACVGFWMKHIVSLLDLVDDIEQGELAVDTLWMEKFTDAHNYLTLLEAIVVERLRIEAARMSVDLAAERTLHAKPHRR